MRALLLLLAIFPLLSHAAPDQRRRTTFQQDDPSTTCTFRPGQPPVCSDGRTITTTRASAVPCETSPGVWTYAPAGTACVSVRGLESWGANTTMIADGSNLGTWPSVGLGSAVSLGDGWWRVVSGGASGATGIRKPAVATSLDSLYTSACIAKPGSRTQVTLGLSGSSPGTPYCASAGIPDGGGIVSCTRLLAPGYAQGVWLYPAPSEPGTDHYIDAIACWFTQASTPGRPCWAEDGSAPFTCAADTHTISTEGWPTEEGEICVTATIGAPAGTNRVILEGRQTGASTNSLLYVTAADTIRLQSDSVQLNGPAATVGATHRICVRRSAGETQLLVDGAQAASHANALLNWTETARLGHSLAFDAHINGSISRLSWSAK